MKGRCAHIQGFQIAVAELEHAHQVVMPRFQGVYHGVFPGEVSPDGTLSDVWVLSRPHNWRPRSAEEALLQISLETGSILRRQSIPTRFGNHGMPHLCRLILTGSQFSPHFLTQSQSPCCRFAHDAARIGDKVYVASTGEGVISELGYPGFSAPRQHRLFTPENHINTMAPAGNGTTSWMWVMQHNLGEVRPDWPPSCSCLASVLCSGRGTLLLLDKRLLLICAGYFLFS